MITNILIINVLVFIVAMTLKKDTQMHFVILPMLAIIKALGNHGKLNKIVMPISSV